MADPGAFISKGRLDALTDGVYAFAMTLLVINIELPDDFHPRNSAELIAGLVNLQDALTAYIITFVVLASFWFGRARIKEEPETATSAYAWAVLFQLFFVTCMPFSMRVLGSYDFAPAVWLYGINMILLALTSILLSLVVERDTGHPLPDNGRVELAVLIASALLSMAISLVHKDGAMYAYFLNFAAPLVRRLNRDPRS